MKKNITDFLLELNLSKVPFQNQAKDWFVRPSIKTKIDLLIKKWELTTTPEIAVLWAKFGQGKTHSLFHIADQIKTNSSKTEVLYTQLPTLRSNSPFVVFYKNIASNLNLEKYQEIVNSKFGGNNLPKLVNHPDPNEKRVLQLLYLSGKGGDSEIQSIAKNYLMGERVLAADLRKLQIMRKPISMTPPPKNAEECRSMLEDTIQTILNLQSDESTFLLLVDEFQRVSQLGPKHSSEIYENLHMIFNNISSHSNGRFRIILAMASADHSSYDSYLSNDLKSRVSTEIALPELSQDDGIYFLKNFLKPLTENNLIEENSFQEIIKIASKHSDGLSPRTIKGVVQLIQMPLILEREESNNLSNPITADEIIKLTKSYDIQSESNE